MSNAVSVSAGVAFEGGEHACALRADGTLVCWGRNDDGQLGTGSAGPPSASPLAVTGLSGVAQVTAGSSSTCARALDGTVSWWGASGQFAGMTNPSTGDFFNPVPQVTEGVSGAVDLESGTVVSCALAASGTLTCWGGDHHQ